MTTDRQMEVLRHLQRAQDNYERVTQRTLAMRAGYDSVSAIHRHLQGLLAQGLVRRLKGGVYVAVQRAEYFIWDEESKALVPSRGREAA